MQKLKNSEIALLRAQLLTEQQGLCALCLEVIEQGKAVLDHCHETGQIRAVLHRGCNAMEGIIKNNQRRNLMSLERMQNLLARILWYQQQLKPMLHPTYKTLEERKAHAKKRAQAKRKKK